MFKIDQSDTYTYPVTLEIVGDKGKAKTSTFTAEFKRFSQSEAEQLSKDLQAQGEDEAKLTDVDFVDEVLVGWADINDQNDSAMAFNAANKALVLDVYGVKAAIIKAFFESISGAKRKN